MLASVLFLSSSDVLCGYFSLSREELKQLIKLIVVKSRFSRHDVVRIKELEILSRVTRNVPRRVKFHLESMDIFAFLLCNFNLYRVFLLFIISINSVLPGFI